MTDGHINNPLLPTFEPTSEDLYQMAVAQPLGFKVDQAIKLLKSFEPALPYYLAYSGGKDSGAIKELAIMAGVKFQPYYNVTTLDPPELVRFIRNTHPDVVWNRPPMALLTMMVEHESCKGPPTRLARWCCQAYKEQGGNGRFKVIGVRGPESPKRKAIWRQVIANRNGGSVLCPVLYWTDEDVWQFHADRKLRYCELYDEGFTRLGCVGCPLGGAKCQRKEFDRWPGFERSWRLAFQRFWAKWTGVPLENPVWEMYGVPNKRAVSFRIGPASKDDSKKFKVAPGELVPQQLRYWRWFEEFDTIEGLWDWWVSGKAKADADECQSMSLFE